MTTKMDGVVQRGLFSQATSIGVYVPKESKYRVLSERLPWKELAEKANEHRSKRVQIDRGAPLNLRLHLGAYIVQTMQGLTDRATEEQVRYHAGVRLLCGLEGSTETIDHTSIETFRNMLGPEGAEALNRIIVESAVLRGFTGSGLCSSDTTVQESPIAHPTEVGHLRKIAEKLAGIGRRMGAGVSKRLGKMSAEVQKTFTKIRLFTRGKGKGVAERKKKLSQGLRKTVARMERLVRGEVERLGDRARGRYEGALAQYRLMLKQIRHWMRTGYHLPGKLVSLWETDARAIVRNKASRAVEFGRRWIITRLVKGYIIGKACAKLGGGSDARILEEVLGHFERMLGANPKLVVYDRGGDGPKNHATLAKRHIRHNGIFRKGKVSQPGLGRNTMLKARRERALSEASIATIKSSRYGFNRPRARSTAGCVLKGHAAILGANLVRFVRDLRGRNLVPVTV